MPKTLTVRAIDTLATPETRREVPDGLVNGLYLVMQPSGARSWAVRYRAAGVPRKLTIGVYPAIDLKSARELAQRALVDVARGGDPAAQKQAAKNGAKAPADRDLVEKVAEQFVERYAKANTRESSWKETQRILNREVVPHWKGRHLGALKRADVHELLDRVVDRGSAIMANRVLAAVRKMCAWAVERGLTETNPCDKVKAPTPERSRDRVLDDNELRRVLEACGTIGWPFGPLFKLLILTGARRDEVGRMKWTELDLKAKLWVLPRERAKNDTQHAVPLSEPALAILNALPRVGEYVFSTNGKTPVSGFANAKERLDLLVGPDMPDFVLHDFRRTTATGMARSGIALPVIEKVLNHVSGSFGGVVGVYNRHSFEAEKKHALEAWGAHVERLMMEPGRNVVALKAAS